MYEIWKWSKSFLEWEIKSVFFLLPWSISSLPHTVALLRMHFQTENVMNADWADAPDRIKGFQPVWNWFVCVYECRGTNPWFRIQAESVSLKGEFPKFKDSSSWLNPEQLSLPHRCVPCFIQVTLTQSFQWSLIVWDNLLSAWSWVTGQSWFCSSMKQKVLHQW